MRYSDESELALAVDAIDIWGEEPEDKIYSTTVHL
jgi:hypothetical protein